MWKPYFERKHVEYQCVLTLQYKVHAKYSIAHNSAKFMEKEKTLSQFTVMKAMDWAYDKAVNGVKGLDSAEEMAADFMKGEGSLKDKANRLIRWQNAKAGTSGFIAGLGGILTLPITLPANITCVLYVQIRMIAAIAKMGGFDLKDDRVKSLVYTCLVASSVKDVIKNTSLAIGQKIAVNALKKVPGEILIKINQQVGFRLLTKFGEKGIINLVKAVPVLGGVIGASFDSISTNIIGNVARDTFIPKEE